MKPELHSVKNDLTEEQVSQAAKILGQRYCADNKHGAHGFTTVVIEEDNSPMAVRCNVCQFMWIVHNVDSEPAE